MIHELPERWVRVELNRDGGAIRIRVTDSGTGVSSLVNEKMFQPFFTTKPVGRGTGLGLSISRGIAEAHGGSLSYELDQGHTSFVLRLPLSRPN
ncbi:MAG: sensor histidine kinase [Bacteriovoracia bacterium]